MSDPERLAFERWLNNGRCCGANENMWKAWLTRSLQDTAVAIDAAPPVSTNDDAQRNRLLAALERASAAESALRALTDECDNEMTPGWEERIRACIDSANLLLATSSQPVNRAMPNLDGDWSPISETLVHRLRDPIPASALSDMPDRMAEAINVIKNEAADAIESLAGQFREMEYLMQCGANTKVSK